MNNLSSFLKFFNILIMVVVIIIISLQNKSSGLGTAFGGVGNIVQTRRGFEKWLFYATIIFGIIFIAINISLLFIK